MATEVETVAREASLEEREEEGECEGARAGRAAICRSSHGRLRSRKPWTSSASSEAGALILTREALVSMRRVSRRARFSRLTLTSNRRSARMMVSGSWTDLEKMRKAGRPLG